MKLLTVTIPCYNSEAYMEKCIESLLSGGDRVEIIIIDDGSTDRTAAISDAYAEKYPGIIKVIHQENGGHGEGINQGIRHASGKYFKIVDSDDTVSNTFPEFLNRLELCETRGGTDLFVTDFRLVYSDGSKDHPIRFRNVLPRDRILRWSDTGFFLIHQVLTIHACTFRTEVLRQIKEDLPRHTFYEDNLLVYSALPHTEKLFYLDRDLYLYSIGRSDQTVNLNNLAKNYNHQILVAKKQFTSCHIDDITKPKLKKYLNHEMLIMFAMSILFARLNQSADADRDLEEMWRYCRAFDKKRADFFRKKTALRLLCIKGKPGQIFNRFIFHLAGRIVRFYS